MNAPASSKWNSRGPLVLPEKGIDGRVLTGGGDEWGRLRPRAPESPIHLTPAGETQNWEGVNHHRGVREKLEQREREGRHWSTVFTVKLQAQQWRQREGGCLGALRARWVQARAAGVRKGGQGRDKGA